MSKLIIYSDGGSRGNPGSAACGAVIKNSKGKIILESSKYLGIATNNQAEYEALILALQKAKEFFRTQKISKKDIECYLDSELVVKHLNHKYKIKDKDLQALFIKVWNLTVDFDSVKFIHIPREENKLADRIVNRELDLNQESRVSSVLF